MTRTAIAAWRSYLPESYLRHARDSRALWFKYIADGPEGGATRRRGMFRFSSNCLWPNDVTRFEETKRLGGLVVDAYEQAAATGQSRPGGSDVRIPRGYTDVVTLHVMDMPGAHSIRRDLEQAAAYIGAHDQLRYRSHVVGVTYREMARLATRAGFEQLEVMYIGPRYERAIQASHRAFCTINNIQREYETAMIHMPTDEFVTRFAEAQSVTV